MHLHITPFNKNHINAHFKSITSAHRKLAAHNQQRLEPKLSCDKWKEHLQTNLETQLLENLVLEAERAAISDYAATAPKDADRFLDWFRELRNSGPGQHDPLFDWLANEATREQMTWFIRQEVAGEAGFEDLTALTQLKFPAVPKLEMARNYWDEMGRGKESAMHGPMLTAVARELGIGEIDMDGVVIESLALANILMGLASHRHYAYHSVGALGVIELTAPDRAQKVYEGLDRLGLSPAGQRYFRLHATIDIKHSQDWEKYVLYPIVKKEPKAARALAEGALMRLTAGARCFEKYRRVLWKNAN